MPFSGFQFGANWSVLAEPAGPIQGPLLGYPFGVAASGVHHFSVTIADAASPASSLRCPFPAIPVIIVYPASGYWIFRGKVRRGARRPLPRPDARAGRADGRSVARAWRGALRCARVAPA